MDLPRALVCVGLQSLLLGLGLTGSISYLALVHQAPGCRRLSRGCDYFWVMLTNPNHDACWGVDAAF